jgi:O-antigen/teichoic acid export membrane protein
VFVKNHDDKNDKISIKPQTLKKNFSWTFLGNIIYAGCQWGMIVVLAHIGSPEMVGKYSLALAITTPILMLTNLQLRVVQATDTKEGYQFGDYLGLRLSMSIIAIIITIVILTVTNYPYYTSLIIIIMCLAKIVESISDVVFGLLQKNENMDRVSISKIYKGILSLASLGIVVFITDSLVAGVIALCLVWLLVLIFYDMKIAKHFTEFKPIFNFSKIIKIVRLSLPLGIVLMMGSLNTNIPRYFLEFYMDEKALGYFAAMAYLIVAGNTVMSALGQSATPRLAKYYADGKIGKFLKLVYQMVGIGFFIGILGILISSTLGYEMLTLLYGEDYAKYSDVFVLIICSGAIYYIGSFIGYGVTAARYFKIQPYIGAVWVLSSLIGSYLLIPSNGLVGAAYVLIISAIVQLLSKIFVLIYLIKKKSASENQF